MKKRPFIVLELADMFVRDGERCLRSRGEIGINTDYLETFTDNQVFMKGKSDPIWVMECVEEIIDTIYFEGEEE